MGKEKIKTYSGGLRQQLGIARVPLNDTRPLITVEAMDKSSTDLEEFGGEST